MNDLPIIDVDIASIHFAAYTHRTAKGRISGKAVETVIAFRSIARMNCEVIIYPTARADMSIKKGLATF